MPTFEELSADIVHLSQNCPFVPVATLNDPIYSGFQSNPQLTDEDEEGMWPLVNGKMDTVFGVEVIEKNLRTGPYGLEKVIEWLGKARQHTSWQHDNLLLIKLGNIRSKMIGQ